MEDKTGWMDPATGKFSVSTTYDIAIGEDCSTDAAKWNSIWKIKVPNRVRTFLWLVTHNRIMTNENKVKRGMTESDKCWCCCNTVENEEHVLRHCALAERVWRAIFPDFSEKTKVLSFSSWLKEGIKNKGNGRHPINTTTVFAMTTSWIWRWRNEAIFNNTIKPFQVKIP